MLQGITQRKSVLKTIIYVNSRKVVNRLAGYLDQRLRSCLRKTALIADYATSLSAAVRSRILEMFMKGETRILIVTDAAEWVLILEMLNLLFNEE